MQLCKRNIRGAVQFCQWSQAVDNPADPVVQPVRLLFRFVNIYIGETIVGGLRAKKAAASFLRERNTCR